MRIPIREQLALLILFASLIGLAVVSVATWVTNRNFVLYIRSSRLEITAALKAEQIQTDFRLMLTSVQAAASRVLIQQALAGHRNGNDSSEDWDMVATDLEAALQGGQQEALLLQAQIYANNANGSAGTSPVLSVTGPQINDSIVLPFGGPNGSVLLGDPGFGYPPTLYPNFTFGQPIAVPGKNITYSTAIYDGDVLNQTSNLLLGPLVVNATFSLLSITVPVINNTSSYDILGWMTIVADARLIYAVLTSSTAMGETGLAILIGPAKPTNLFSPGILYTNNTGPPAKHAEVQVLIPLAANQSARHPNHTYGTANPPFDMSQYPAIVEALTVNHEDPNNGGSLLSTTSEAGQSVSVGYAIPNIPMANWLLLIELEHGEVWEPITHLRDLLLACVFGTAGVMALLAFPTAHWAIVPIRRLRAATKQAVDPSDFSDNGLSFERGRSRSPFAARPAGVDDMSELAIARKEGYIDVPSRLKQLLGMQPREKQPQRPQRKGFRIPGKVKDPKHVIHDELTDLTQTFNEMSDELMMHYERLEERVKQRTAELELSKKEAEAANESKTLFIANISHELKTPLNGILGMCAVCMQEDDPAKLKRSLGIIYKSGDLLLNLLTDLLTFSKNQVGQQLQLDEKEFRLQDISSQVKAIFDKQASEGEIDMRIKFEGPEIGSVEGMPGAPNEYGPQGTGKVQDMVVWGDQHRILQVVINLVSNSLKFTPKGGSVWIAVRCLGEVEPNRSSSRIGSIRTDRTNRSRSSLPQSRRGGKAARIVGESGEPSIATASIVEITDKAKAFTRTRTIDRSASPPPGRQFVFEFEVQDTGPGIPPHQQKSVFEPFVQGDLGLSKKYGGTGLGLSICSQLADLMRGSIRLQSEEGLGSTFTMSIPLLHVKNRTASTASSSATVSRSNSATQVETTRKLVRDQDSSSAPHKANGTAEPPPPITTNMPGDSQPRLVGLSQPFFATSPGPGDVSPTQKASLEAATAAEMARGKEKIKVLVAEDNQVNQEVVLRMLKLEAIYDVIIARDGQEAYDLVVKSIDEGNTFDLILMDIQMPNLDGLQSTKLIRQAGYSAPIVALTAFSEESNVRECIGAGMNYFLSKPIKRPALKKVLKTYFSPIQELEEPGSPADRLLAREVESMIGTTAVIPVTSLETPPLPNGVDEHAEEPVGNSNTNGHVDADVDHGDGLGISSGDEMK